MAEIAVRDRIQPYLLDRLTQENPTARQESLQQRTWTLRQAHQAVVRDLGWLLNAPARPEADGLEEFPEVARSVLNYGIPDLCGRTASGVSGEQLRRLLLQAIQRFEPRVMRHTLAVRLAEDGEAKSVNAIVLEIKAQIWASPLPDSLYLKTELDLESGRCILQDKQYG